MAAMSGSSALSDSRISSFNMCCLLFVIPACPESRVIVDPGQARMTFVVSSIEKVWAIVYGVTILTGMNR